MKFIAVFAAVLAVAVATPSNTWTLQDLDSALSNPTTSRELIPILERALDIFMENLYHGQQMAPSAIVTQSGIFATLTLQQLNAVITSPTISVVYKPFLEDALNQMMEAIFDGESITTINVHLPQMSIAYWSLQDLNEALASAETPKELKPVLIEALDKLMEAIFDGANVNSVVVAAPTELLVKPEVTPSPVIVAEETPASVPASRPLVQIIVNVQNRESDSVAAPVAPVAPVEEIEGPVPTPVLPGVAIQPIPA